MSYRCDVCGEKDRGSGCACDEPVLCNHCGGVIDDIDLLSTMNTAPKDHTPILAKLKDDLSEYDQSGNLERLQGLWVVVNHHEVKNDFSMGWSLAGPFGYGGLPDQWFDGWLDLPPINT